MDTCFLIVTVPGQGWGPSLNSQGHWVVKKAHGSQLAAGKVS